MKLEMLAWLATGLYPRTSIKDMQAKSLGHLILRGHFRKSVILKEPQSSSVQVPVCLQPCHLETETQEADAEGVL